jgi:hypothetical protein
VKGIKMGLSSTAYGVRLSFFGDGNYQTVYFDIKQHDISSKLMYKNCSQITKNENNK